MVGRNKIQWHRFGFIPDILDRTVIRRDVKTELVDRDRDWRARWRATKVSPAFRRQHRGQHSEIGQRLAAETILVVPSSPSAICHCVVANLTMADQPRWRRGP
jgi:hypothetical protein